MCRTPRTRQPTNVRVAQAYLERIGGRRVPGGCGCAKGCGLPQRGWWGGVFFFRRRGWGRVFAPGGPVERRPGFFRCQGSWMPSLARFVTAAPCQPLASPDPPGMLAADSMVCRMPILVHNFSTLHDAIESIRSLHGHISDCLYPDDWLRMTAVRVRLGPPTFLGPG